MTGSPRRKTTPLMRRVIGLRYKAGVGFRELARVFSLHPSTVRRIVEGQGIGLRRRRVLDAARRAEMAEKYRAGRSVRALAVEYRVAYGTAYNALSAAGVAFRRRGGAR